MRSRATRIAVIRRCHQRKLGLGGWQFLLSRSKTLKAHSLPKSEASGDR